MPMLLAVCSAPALLTVGIAPLSGTSRWTAARTSSLRGIRMDEAAAKAAWLARLDMPSWGTTSEPPTAMTAAAAASAGVITRGVITPTAPIKESAPGLHPGRAGASCRGYFEQAMARDGIMQDVEVSNPSKAAMRRQKGRAIITPTAPIKESAPGLAPGRPGASARGYLAESMANDGIMQIYG